MANWYPVIRPGDREYTFDLPQQVRHLFLASARERREDFPEGWPNGGITNWDFVDRGADYLVGDQLFAVGGNSDAFGFVRGVDPDTGAVVVFDFISLGTGYSIGETTFTGGTGTDFTILVTEVA